MRLMKPNKKIIALILLVFMVTLIPFSSHAEVETKYATGFYVYYEGNHIFIDIYTFLNYKTESMLVINSSETGLKGVIFIRQDGKGITLGGIIDNEDFVSTDELVDLALGEDYTKFNPTEIPEPVEFRVIDIY